MQIQCSNMSTLATSQRVCTPCQAALTFALQTAVAHLAHPATVGTRQIPGVQAAVALDHQCVATSLYPRVAAWRVKVTASAHCLHSSQSQITK